MQPAERRKRELEEVKKVRMKEVIEKAAIIFCENGIDNTKVTDIAKEANIGVASVYRYFQTKADIVIQVGIKFWKDEAVKLYEKFNTDSFKRKQGLEQAEELLNVFMTLYKEHKNFLRYINYFDNYVVKEQIDALKLVEYEQNVINIKELIINAIKRGQADNTIRSTIDPEEFYITITHMLMSLVQKLALTGDILICDGNVPPERQIEEVIKMVLFYVKA